MEFRIESHEHEGGLRSIQPGMRDAADDLREILRDMEALLRVANGEGSAADVERLEIEPDADPVDVVPEWVDSWALDVQASDSRVMFLLGTGGPHIELDIPSIPSNESYGVEGVILRRSWSPAYDRAWTNDERALDIVADFLDLIGRHYATSKELPELCSQCGDPLADGEGWDGLCGSCADRAEQDNEKETP